MSRTGRGMTLISWGLPLIVACSFGQAPLNRPGMRLLHPPARPGAAARSAVAPRPAIATPAVPSGPLPQVPMSQLPSAPPQVTYQNGMLTILAQNSSLGDILREVHRTTGAVIEVPSNATERVVASIGPGPARDVMATLLNGTAFNYVMVGSATDPTTLATVMLTTKSGGPTGETVANAYQPAPQYAPQQAMMPPGAGPGGPVVQQAANDEEADAEEEKDEEDPAEEDQAQDQAQSGVVPAPDGSQPNAGPKTPEQILEMLRQRPGQAAPGQQLMRPPGQQQPPPDNQDNQ